MVAFPCNSRESDCNWDASSVSFPRHILYFILSDEFIKRNETILLLKKKAINALFLPDILRVPSRNTSRGKDCVTIRCLLYVERNVGLIPDAVI